MNNEKTLTNPPKADRENGIASPRCAFYHAAMPAPGASSKRKSAKASPAGLDHRCLLNPGRPTGPDGREIGLTGCTLDRQSLCQAERRAALAKLHDTTRQVVAASRAASG